MVPMWWQPTQWVRLCAGGARWLYGLMAGGRAGVDRMIAILESEIRRTMGLLGVSNVAELHPKHVTQLMRLAPRDVLGRVSDSRA